MTIMHLGRRRFVLTFHIESGNDDRGEDLEQLKLAQAAHREAESRRALWEIEHMLVRSRIF